MFINNLKIKGEINLNLNVYYDEKGKSLQEVIEQFLIIFYNEYMGESIDLQREKCYNEDVFK